ncbi:hypothetical protein OROHE_007223 [Orobanche hederae]
MILPADTITDIKKRRAKNALNKPLAFRSPFLGNYSFCNWRS